MPRNEIQVMDGKRYIVIVCRFRGEWRILHETEKGVTEGEAIEICNYWLKYKEINSKEIRIIEVPDITKP